MFIRITPACAGKTGSGGVDPSGDGDHPRMRGEDHGEALTVTILDGSPPHARGRRRDRLVSDDVDGITPACAGKTW